MKMYSETQVHKIRFSASPLTRRPIFPKKFGPQNNLSSTTLQNQWRWYTLFLHPSFCHLRPQIARARRGRRSNTYVLQWKQLRSWSLDQFTVLLKLKSTFKRITRLAAFQSLRIGKHWTYLFRKFEQVARSTSEQYIFEISKQFQSWIFNDVWSQTCAPTISLKFLWHIHCINKSRYQKFR